MRDRRDRDIIRPRGPCQIDSEGGPGPSTAARALPPAEVGALGRQQAQTIADLLVDKTIKLAFQTRLSRSRETLQIVLKSHPECKKILTDDRLLERSYGDLAGETHQEIINGLGVGQYEQWHRGFYDQPPGGESFADVEGPIIWDPLTGKIILRPPNSDNRKKIIGPLMNSIMANALGQPKDKLAGIFQAGFKSLIEKHVLFYIFDQNVEKAVADVGLGGTIKDYNGDYLHVNDANLGGRKSNLYATEDVAQDIKVAGDGSVVKTVTITYKNPQSQDGWLNSVLPTWVRVYVPKGSTLITSEGLEAKADPYEDLGKTVFAGYFQLRPEGVSKVTFQYKLPFKVSRTYNLLIQKQPGTDGFLYTVNIGKTSEEFYLKTDKELKIGL